MALTHADYEARQAESNWKSRFYSTLPNLCDTDETVVKRSIDKLKKLLEEALENDYTIPKVSDPKVLDFLEKLGFKNSSS